MAKDDKKISSDLADLAREFGRAKVSKPEHEQKLREIGFTDFSNNALVVASVFASAVNGDDKAVARWQELTGTTEEPRKETDGIEAILKKRGVDGKSKTHGKHRA